MKKPARKILSLVTTIAATAGVASANPERAKLPDRETDGETATVVLLGKRPFVVRADAAPVPISAAEFGRYLGETQPLTGPDGRPGCGNILVKGPTGCEQAQLQAVTARVRAAQVDAPSAARENAVALRIAARIERAKQLLATAAKAK
jgi:hypothetical protein